MGWRGADAFSAGFLKHGRCPPKRCRLPMPLLDAIIKGGRNVRYTDEDLTFFLSVYRDHDAANRCLARLRCHFPGARVIVRSDGDADPRHERLVGRYRVDYHADPRLFPIEHGGSIITRMLDLYLHQPSRYLFKIDPDTMVHRRFRYLPTRDGHFGTLQGGFGFRSIQGGCMGLTLSTARCILASNLLSGDDLKCPQRFRHRSRHWHIAAARAERVGLSSFDWTLGWIASELRIPLFSFREVHSLWKGSAGNRGLKYAITHPEG